MEGGINWLPISKKTEERCSAETLDDLEGVGGQKWGAMMSVLPEIMDIEVLRC